MRVFSVLLALATGMSAAVLSYLSTDLENELLRMPIVILSLFLAFFIQIIIHESGHLLFGLLTGYTFSSFRILSCLFKKEDGRIAVRRLNLSGTAGQCLMGPPDPVDGRIPHVLYNLGGVLMNLISAALSVLMCVLLSAAGRNWFFFAMLALAGIYFALTNGIPFGAGAVPNDGYNAVHLGKDPEAIGAFWKQLKISQQQGEGVRLKDMPEEWFTVGEGADLGNPLISAVRVFGVDRAMDCGALDEAGELIDRLNEDGVSLTPLYKALLAAESVFLEALEKGSGTDLSPVTEKSTAAILKQMKDFPSVIRMDYAVAALVEKDAARADTALEAFEKVAKTYPNPVVIDSERELFSLVRNSVPADAGPDEEE